MTWRRHPFWIRLHSRSLHSDQTKVATLLIRDAVQPGSGRDSLLVARIAAAIFLALTARDQSFVEQLACGTHIETHF